VQRIRDNSFVCLMDCVSLFTYLLTLVWQIDYGLCIFNATVFPSDIRLRRYALIAFL